MKYFIDTEFLEGTQKTGMFRLKTTPPTIDLISIGIVSEDGREYYAISNDFNLKEAWNRYDIKDAERLDHTGIDKVKVYWIRDNVLRPIFDEFVNTLSISGDYKPKFEYKTMKFFITMFGISNKQIAKEVIDFCRPNSKQAYNYGADMVIEPVDFPEFYGYYCDYDWVVFSWLYGKMINLPKGFPMYCIDLKQKLDEIAESRSEKGLKSKVYLSDWFLKHFTKDECIKGIKNNIDYPKETNAHNALADAKWNKKLYEFLKQLPNA